MSIAVSAVVQRSGMLSSALLAMGMFCLCIGAVIGFGLISPLPVLQRSLLGGCCVLAAVAALREVGRSHADRRIDVSGTGQIQVTDLQLPVADSTTYRLLSTSTLWSFLLVLDMRSNEGRRLTLIVLPDTMTQASFRALCVACQWIAAHNIRGHAENS
ncbi:MAG: hypothetical protein H7234_09435 [Herminiimonas sp.]|nr:hypothetical protein [Herminiimonas sp.]